MSGNDHMNRNNGRITLECVVRCNVCGRSQALDTDDEVTAAANAHYLTWWFDREYKNWWCPKCAA